MPRFRSQLRLRGVPIEIDDAVLTLTHQEAAKIEWPIGQRLGRIYFVGMLLALGALAARLIQLNVFQGEHFSLLAFNNATRAIPIPAPRGIIRDSFGTPLVQNVPSIDAVLLPARLPQAVAERTVFFDRLRKLFPMEEAAWQTFLAQLDATTHGGVTIQENLNQETVIRFLSQSDGLPGVTLVKTARREYADGQVFAHVLGYVGKIEKDELPERPGYALTDVIGKQGIEKAYETALRGSPGMANTEVDALGTTKKDLGLTPPIPGQDVWLHIDAPLQKSLYHAIEHFLNEKSLQRGAAIALDPRNGAVKALVSFPSYDNNLFAQGISSADYATLIHDPDLPLFNRAISGAYPPGSTIKPLLAAAALAEHIITPETSIESRGGIQVGHFFFGDWRAHGFTDLRRAIAVSSDVYFYTLGGGYGGRSGLGMDRMKRYEELFGWGKPTGIDLPGEITGFLPDPTWKRERFGERWYIGDDYHAAIGQGFVTATPLQIVNAVAAIANGGTLYVPEVVASEHAPDGRIQPKAPIVVREHFIDPGILRIVREGMRETVTEGTARSLADLPVEVAGKTGTAQFGNEEKTHGWFVSFAPYEAPELALIVLVEGQGEEGYNAVPITKTVLSEYFSRPK